MFKYFYLRIFFFLIFFCIIEKIVTLMLWMLWFCVSNLPLICIQKYNINKWTQPPQKVYISQNVCPFSYKQLVNKLNCLYTEHISLHLFILTQKRLQSSYLWFQSLNKVTHKQKKIYSSWFLIRRMKRNKAKY